MPENLASIDTDMLVKTVKTRDAANVGQPTGPANCDFPRFRRFDWRLDFLCLDFLTGRWVYSWRWGLSSNHVSGSSQKQKGCQHQCRRLAAWEMHIIPSGFRNRLTPHFSYSADFQVFKLPRGPQSLQPRRGIATRIRCAYKTLVP
jgi:hypothetical protein